MTYEEFIQKLTPAQRESLVMDVLIRGNAFFEKIVEEDGTETFRRIPGHKAYIVGGRLKASDKPYGAVKK